MNSTDVIAVEIKDSPGGLANSLEYLRDSSINIEYLYAFLTKASNAALVVFRVEQIDEAIRVLQEKGIRVLEGSEVYSL